MRRRRSEKRHWPSGVMVTLYKNVSDAYNAIVSGDKSKSWAVFSYEKGTDDLKVSSQGSRGYGLGVPGADVT